MTVRGGLARHLFRFRRRVVEWQVDIFSIGYIGGFTCQRAHQFMCKRTFQQFAIRDLNNAVNGLIAALIDQFSPN